MQNTKMKNIYLIQILSPILFSGNEKYKGILDYYFICFSLWKIVFVTILNETR